MEKTPAHTSRSSQLRKWSQEIQIMPGDSEMEDLDKFCADIIT